MKNLKTLIKFNIEFNKMKLNSIELHKDFLKIENLKDKLWIANSIANLVNKLEQIEKEIKLKIEEAEEAEGEVL